MFWWIHEGQKMGWGKPGEGGGGGWGGGGCGGEKV
jgi:hypothetical protein